MNVLYVYGTLRPEGAETVDIPGEMFRVGWFPGVRLGDNPDETFKACRVEVDDQRLRSLDSYEGYNENNPESSLFIRTPIEVDGESAEIYVYNGSFDGLSKVEDGDWFSVSKPSVNAL